MAVPVSFIETLDIETLEKIASGEVTADEVFEERFKEREMNDDSKYIALMSHDIINEVRDKNKVVNFVGRKFELTYAEIISRINTEEWYVEAGEIAMMGDFSNREIWTRVVNTHKEEIQEVTIIYCEKIIHDNRDELLKNAIIELFAEKSPVGIEVDEFKRYVELEVTTPQTLVDFIKEDSHLLSGTLLVYERERSKTDNIVLLNRPIDSEVSAFRQIHNDMRLFGMKKIPVEKRISQIRQQVSEQIKDGLLTDKEQVKKQMKELLKELLNEIQGLFDDYCLKFYNAIFNTPEYQDYKHFSFEQRKSYTENIDKKDMLAFAIENMTATEIREKYPIEDSVENISNEYIADLAYDIIEKVRNEDKVVDYACFHELTDEEIISHINKEKWYVRAKNMARRGYPIDKIWEDVVNDFKGDIQEAAVIYGEKTINDNRDELLSFGIGILFDTKSTAGIKWAEFKRYVESKVKSPQDVVDFVKDSYIRNGIFLEYESELSKTDNIVALNRTVDLEISEFKQIHEDMFAFAVGKLNVTSRRQKILRKVKEQIESGLLTDEEQVKQQTKELLEGVLNEIQDALDYYCSTFYSQIFYTPVYKDCKDFSFEQRKAYIENIDKKDILAFGGRKMTAAEIREKYPIEVSVEDKDDQTIDYREVEYKLDSWLNSLLKKEIRYKSAAHKKLIEWSGKYGFDYIQFTRKLSIDISENDMFLRIEEYENKGMSPEEIEEFVKFSNDYEGKIESSIYEKLDELSQDILTNHREDIAYELFSTPAYHQYANLDISFKLAYINRIQEHDLLLFIKWNINVNEILEKNPIELD